MFFCLSGYLVWNSVKTTKSSKEYFLKRFLRIYPELWIAVLFEIITILLFYRDKIEYIGLSAFAITQSTVFQFWTPDFLRGFGCGTPNGSLWTICTIVQFYIVVWFLRKFLQNKKPIFWVLLLGVSVLVSYCTPHLQNFLPGIGYKLFCQTLVPYLWLFVLGLFICEFSNTIIPLLRKYWVVPLMVYVIIHFLLAEYDLSLSGYPLMGCILMVLSVVGIAYAFPTIDIKKDISYGVYIYHMIVVNVLIQMGMTGNWYYTLVVLAVTVGLSLWSSFVMGRITQQLKIKVKQ